MEIAQNGAEIGYLRGFNAPDQPIRPIEGAPRCCRYGVGSTESSTRALKVPCVKDVLGRYVKDVLGLDILKTECAIPEATPESKRLDSSAKCGYGLFAGGGAAVL